MTGWQSADRAKTDFRSCAISVRFPFIQSLRWSPVTVTSIEFALSPGIALSASSSLPSQLLGSRHRTILVLHVCVMNWVLCGDGSYSVSLRKGAVGGEAEVLSLQ